MTTTPFDPQVAALVTGPHACTVTAVATITGGATVPLTVVAGRVGWSERRAPMVTADLEVATPDDPATLAALDPRLRVRVALSVTYTLPNGHDDTHTVANLHLRAREVNRPATTTRLTLASDEALVIDSAPNATRREGGDGTDPDSTTKTDGPGWLATMIREGLWNLDYPTGPTIVVTADAAPAEWPVDIPDYWDAIVDVADQLDLDVYDNGDRVFRIAPRPQTASRSVLTVKGGPGGILLDSRSSITRDSWANFVALRYAWTAPTGVQRSVYGTARVTAGPYSTTAVGYKTVAEQRDTATSGTAARAAAKALLNRMLSRSRGLDLTTVPAWWVRPFHTITYQPENGAAQRHLVSEVEFDLSAATMRLVTRLPDTDSTLGE